MLTGELDLEAGTAARPRVVEVAIDAAGGGGARTYTYVLPEHLADVALGEPVLVEFGRRQALAVVLGDTDAPPGIELKPVAARVRSDGPLLPPLSIGLARWIAAHYLAPPAVVVRAMLPPGMMEKLDLVAERAPEGEVPLELTPADRDLLDQLQRGPRAVRALVAPEGRAGLIRRLRALEARGVLALEWTLSAAGAGPRYERRVALTPDGRDAAVALAAGERPPGRALGPRQAAALAELLAATDPAVAATDVADRHGHATVAGLARRGLVAVEVRERPRDPLAARPPGLRGARPPGASLTEPQEAAVALIRRAIADRDSTPLLLDGVTGGGKTAIYVEAIAAALEAGRPALVLVPEIALATPIVDRLRADLGVRVALVHSGLSDGERADEWRRIRAGDVDIVAGTRLAVLAPLRDVGVVIVDEEHEAAYKSDRTPRLQARDTAIHLGELARAAVVLGSATPAVDSVGRARDGAYRRVVLPTRPTGEPPAVEVVDLREELRDGNRGLISGRLAAALAALDRGPRRPGDPRHQPPRDRVGRPVPRLRPRPGVPGLRPAARLPPGRRHAPLPPLRPGVPARVPLSKLPLSEDQVPRRRHGASRARGPGTLPGAASRPPGSRRRRAARRGGAGPRRVRGGPARRPRRDEPRREGPRRPERDARRRRLGRRVPEPARRARGGADLPAARPGGRPGRARRAAGGRDHPVLPARAPGDPGRRRRRRGRVLRRRARLAAAVRVTAVRTAREADLRDRGPGRRGDDGAGHGRRPPAARR